jgi:chaperonin GroEL
VVDALEAVKSAQAEGILAGGGSALVYFSKRLSKEKLDLTSDEETGVKVLVEAMREPIKTIARNCGVSEEQILSRQLANNKLGMGFNFATGKFVDLILSGVIDPARVTRCALENAVSAASTLLTTSHAIIEIGN